MVGCRRAGLELRTIRSLRAAFHEIHSHLSATQAAAVLASNQSVPEVRELLEFIQSTRRGIVPSSVDSEPVMSSV